MVKKIYLSWEEFGAQCEALAAKIKKSRCKFDGVYGPPRGGLPLAVFMSHKLKLKLLLYPTQDSLVVDDISDTGRTLASHKNKKIATLYSTPWTATKPDWFVADKLEEDSWIIYPWEE